MPFELPPLPYDLAALEPAIGRETMRLHRGLQHRAYVEATNRALASYPDLRDLTIEEVLRGLDGRVPPAIRAEVRDQGGGHANHQLFWKVMTPGGSPMPAPLRAQVERDFGSVGAMRARFEAAGRELFGSGWVFLVLDPAAGRLDVLTTPGEGSVLPLGKPALLANDVWEHAYVLDYPARRADYLAAWWDVVHWAYVGERLRGIREGRGQL